MGDRPPTKEPGSGHTTPSSIGGGQDDAWQPPLEHLKDPPRGTSEVVRPPSGSTMGGRLPTSIQHFHSYGLEENKKCFPKEKTLFIPEGITILLIFEMNRYSSS